jgi:hypothetical protein
MPTTGLSIWLQNDEHDDAQNALNTVYATHTSHASPLKRTTNVVLKYQMSDHVKKGPLDLCWIICASIDHRIIPLINYLTSLLVATKEKNDTNNKHHNMIVDITQTINDSTIENEEDLTPDWNGLIGDDRMKYTSIRLCNLGLYHPQSKRHLNGVAKFLFLPGDEEPLPPMNECQCGNSRSLHVRMPRKYSTEGTYVNEKTAIITLLLLDGMQKKRKPYMDQHKIDETLHDLMPRMMPALRRRMSHLGQGISSPCCSSKEHAGDRARRSRAGNVSHRREVASEGQGGEF